MCIIHHFFTSMFASLAAGLKLSRQGLKDSLCVEAAAGPHVPRCLMCCAVTARALRGGCTDYDMCELPLPTVCIACTLQAQPVVFSWWTPWTQLQAASSHPGRSHCVLAVKEAFHGPCEPLWQGRQCCRQAVLAPCNGCQSTLPAFPLQGTPEVCRVERSQKLRQRLS